MHPFLHRKQFIIAIIYPKKEKDHCNRNSLPLSYFIFFLSLGWGGGALHIFFGLVSGSGHLA